MDKLNKNDRKTDERSQDTRSKTLAEPASSSAPQSPLKEMRLKNSALRGIVAVIFGPEEASFLVSNGRIPYSTQHYDMT
jgi:hypothetical protein